MDDEGQDLLPLPGIEEGQELLSLDDARAPARYTGALIESQKAKRDAILQLLAVGVGINKIAKHQHVSVRTVALLRERYSVKIATHKKSLARRFGLFAELGIERAIDEVELMDRDKLMISVGIATEKMQLLDGEATAIIGQSEAGPSHEDITAKLDSLLKQAIPVEAEEMGCGTDPGATNARAGLEAPEMGALEDGSSVSCVQDVDNQQEGS